jgi:hypothetical protein
MVGLESAVLCTYNIQPIYSLSILSYLVVKTVINVTINVQERI